MKEFICSSKYRKAYFYLNKISKHRFGVFKTVLINFKNTNIRSHDLFRKLTINPRTMLGASHNKKSENFNYVQSVKIVPKITWINIIILLVF